MKKVKILLLPTDNAENCIIKKLGKLHYYPKKYFTQGYIKEYNAQSFHLYITLIDAKEGYWQINHLTNKISIRDDSRLEIDARNYSRVIASTDPKLTANKDIITKLELSFINDYCNTYPDLPEYASYDFNRNGSDFKHIKNKFSREEVEMLLHEFYEKLCAMTGLEEERDNFIKNI